jgi:hypothetical protein
MGAGMPIPSLAPNHGISATANSVCSYLVSSYISLYSHKPPDTVGELKSADICGAHMPSLKAKKLGKLAQEKVLLEL